MNELMQFVVRHRWTLDAAFAKVPVAAADQEALRDIVNTELDDLEEHNCAVYNLRETRLENGLPPAGAGNTYGC
jgi:hypothetical protein